MQIPQVSRHFKGCVVRPDFGGLDTLHLGIDIILASPWFRVPFHGPTYISTTPIH